MHPAARYQHSGVVQLQPDRGRVGMMAKNQWGETSLHRAALSGNQVGVRFLLDPVPRSKRNTAPLICVIESSHNPLIKLLLARCK